VSIRQHVHLLAGPGQGTGRQVDVKGMAAVATSGRQQIGPKQVGHPASHPAPVHQHLDAAAMLGLAGLGRPTADHQTVGDGLEQADDGFFGRGGLFFAREKDFARLDQAHGHVCGRIAGHQAGREIELEAVAAVAQALGTQIRPGLVGHGHGNAPALQQRFHGQPRPGPARIHGPAGRAMAGDAVHMGPNGSGTTGVPGQEGQGPQHFLGDGRHALHRALARKMTAGISPDGNRRLRAAGR